MEPSVGFELSWESHTWHVFQQYPWSCRNNSWRRLPGISQDSPQHIFILIPSFVVCFLHCFSTFHTELFVFFLLIYRSLYMFLNTTLCSFYMFSQTVAWLLFFKILLWKFQTYRKADFYSQYSSMYLLDSTTNILLYRLYHLSIILPICQSILFLMDFKVSLV